MTEQNTTHPLRLAVTRAEGVLAAALAARESLDADDTVDGDDPRYEAALAAETEAEEALEQAQQALTGSDCPRQWYLSEEGEGYDAIEASSAEEALYVARNNVDRSNYPDADERTIWIKVRVQCPETEEADFATVALDPDEPECDDDAGHDWQSPHRLVGGLAENPGIHGHGGGVIITRVCMRCGCKRVTDTWAQNPDTGEQGLESVSYEEHAFTADELEDT